MNLIKKTKFIDLYQVSKKAFAAISNNPLTMSNAGFIDLGDKAIIFDTFLSLEASLELEFLVKEYTRAKQLIVVNSHSHFDHFLGNSVYEDTMIISSKRALEMINQMEYKIQFGEKIHKKDIEALNLKLKNVKDLEEINEIENSLIILNNLSNDNNKIVLPNFTISNDVTIYGSKGSFSLHVIGKAHSDGDLIGRLMDEKIAYVGDLIFAGEHPYFGAGDPMALINELELLYSEDIEYFIPGHGMVCGKDEIINQIEYIKNLMDVVSKNLNRPENISILDMNEKFHEMKSTTFRWNVNFLVDYYKQ